jgi:hypothetical protein
VASRGEGLAGEGPREGGVATREKRSRGREVAREERSQERGRGREGVGVRCWEGNREEAAEKGGNRGRARV